MCKAKHFDHYQSRGEINFQDQFSVISLAVFMNYQTKEDIEFKVQQKKIICLYSQVDSQAFNLID